MQTTGTNAKATSDLFEEARQELELARQWFDWVTEPHLVDEAIYRVRAAEMRLTALSQIRRARYAAEAEAGAPFSPSRFQALAR